MAHKMAIHVGHYKKGSVGALEHHNLRENARYSNKDIDESRTKDNIVLHQPEQSQYLEAKRIIEQRATNQVRSTSIWQSEFVISSDKEFFNSLTKAEQDRFFKESYEYLSNEFGKENVTCATVHYDESTPHMHFDFVPMTEENKLSRKEVMTRERLIKIQDQMPKYLKEKGFDIERGQKMTELDQKDRPKHIEPKEYKKALNEQIRALERQKNKLDAAERNLQRKAASLQKEQKKLSSAEADLKAKAESYNAEIKGMNELPKAEKNIMGKMQLPETDYNKLYSAAQFGMASHQQQETLKKNNKKLKEACNELNEENKRLKDKLPTMTEQLQQKQQLAKVGVLERENAAIKKENTAMKNVLLELQKMKLPERAAEMVRNVLKTFDKVIQKQHEQRGER
ncbi:MAG: plasmid recombination protein [Butyrivibrio sp.]|nr:plasmid recombination protein [Butyrivibrio sp.]